MIQEKCRISEEELLTYHTRVLILGIDNDGEILVLSKPTRFSDEWLLEMPCGDVLYRERPEDAAVRVLLTETGMLADNIEPLGRYMPRGSIIDVVYLFSAIDLTAIKSPINFSYETQLIRLSPGTLGDLIQEGLFQQEAGIKAFTQFYLPVR
jgi:8-oxo-dGTP pyrophosphatase MutT (NUDIX family)